jgi:putative GTP pyrophosphokinase
MNYEKWDEILAPYQHAVEELKVKFKNIRKEFLTKGEYSPIEFVTGRTKKISSIISKANRLDTNDIEGEIEDIAGIRIMCQFVEDIYTIVELIKNRTDMTVINEKDYITNFKESGYRSYHVIIKYTVNMVDGAKDILAEFQIRTLAMNFWATAEHSLNYKYKQHIPEEIKIRLKKAADAAFELDQQMLEIKDEIKDAQKLFEVKSDIISSIMNNILTLISLGKVAEAARYEVLLNRLIEEGEVWELNNLLDITKKDLERYKDN